MSGSKPPNTRKIVDTSSSHRSGESAPEPASKLIAGGSQDSATAGEPQSVGGGLARVTSYNQLERNVDEDDQEGAVGGGMSVGDGEDEDSYEQDFEQDEQTKPADP